MTAATPVTPRLQVNDTTGRRVVPIDKPVFRIGRRSESDLRVVGGDVSREHAEIEQDSTGRCVLRDRGSRCGTFVNSQPVTERVLVHGDQIRLGRSAEAELVFLLDESTPSHPHNTSVIADFRQISVLLDGLRALGTARVLDEVLALVMDSAIEVTGAERGFIMLAGDAGDLEFKIGRARGRVPLSGRLFETSHKIPRQVFATGQEQIVADLMDGNMAEQHLGTVALGIRHVLCTPLRVVQYVDRADAPPEVRRIGVLYLDGREKGRTLSAVTRHALDAFATEAAAAIESAHLYRESAEKRRLEGELQLAAEIQRALLPEPCQSGTHYEVASNSIPCRAIGGDFYDYFPLAGGAFGFALGDVAGKGPSAALLTAMIQGIFSAHVGTAASAAPLMALANEGLLRRSIQSRFATVVYGALAPDGRLTYCNAGHNPPVLLGRGGVRRLETGGLILGLFPQATYEQETLALESGDLLVMFSDGVTEALDAAGEEFGEERLLACIEANRQCQPAELLARLLASVRTFVAGAAQHDDVTALVLRYQVK
jgi:serine phosphatase RsbU (regulator of sigma subunit)/pSer/pThr/pTyr-binding forkhead associated (FHA) protein